MSPHSPTANRTNDRPATVILYTVATAFVALFTLVALQMHATFATSAYDLGLFDQGFWRYSQLLPNFNTVRGMNLLGDHFSPISLIFAPLYRIHADIGWTFLLQSLSVALGGIMLAALVHHYLPNRPWLALGVALAYWLHPAVHNTLLWQYHEIALASGLYVVLIWSYLKDRRAIFLVTLLLLLACREDMPFTLVAFGVVALIDRRWRYAAWTIGLSVLWWLLATRVAMPLLNGVGYFRASHGAVFLVISNLDNPAFYIERLTRPESLAYLWKVAVPAGILGLLAPRYLLPALPTLGANMLLGDYNTKLMYHYSVSVMPFFFWSAIVAMQRISAWRDGTSWRRWSPVVLAVAMIAGSLVIARMESRMAPATLAEKVRQWNNYAPKRAHVAALNERLGNEGVAASDWLLPHLAHRERIYLFPNPWLTSYWGIQEREPHHPNVIDHIVLSADAIQEYRDLYDYLVDSGTFELLSSDYDVFVLRRIKPEAADRAQAIANIKSFNKIPPPAFANVTISPSFSTPESEFNRLDVDLKALQKKAPNGSFLIGTLASGETLDLFLNLENDTDLRTRYVRTEVDSPGACQARMMLGSDDGVTVWLNGEPMHENIVRRGVNPNDDKVVLPLKRGKNVLVFRVNNVNGAWRLMATLKMLRC